MANFTRANPTGWALYEVLTSAQMNTIDINITKCANFSEGSTHTPSAVVEVGGSGLKISSGTLLDIDGSASLAGPINVTSGGAVVVENGADLSIYGDADVENGATFEVKSGGSIDINAGATHHDHSNPTFYGDVAINSGGSFSLDSGANGTIAGTLEFEARVACSSLGAVMPRLKVLTDADVGLDISDGNLFLMPSGVMSTNRTVTWSSTGAQEGDIFEVYTNEGTYNLQFNGYAHQNSSGNRSYSKWLRYSTVWYLLDEYIQP